jgi:uncharacterized membrane protein
MWKEEAMTYFKELFQNGGAEENRKESQVI